MTINAFWFGVQMTVVVEIMVMIVFAIIVSHRAAEDDDMSGDAIANEEQFKEYLRGVLEEIAAQNKFIIGEAIEDHEDDKEEA